MVEEKTMGIYCIENIINNKKYIGQSCDIYSRWQNHKWCLNNNKHSNDFLQNSWNLHGEENFIFYVLEFCDETIINEREQYYIHFYSTLIDLNGYNLDSGGNQNKRHSNITKMKISKAHMGKKLSKETRIKISKNRKGKLTGESHFMFGKHHTIETKEKLSKALTGMFANEKHWSATKVICLNTGEVFPTMKQAGEEYNTFSENIHKCCKGERISSGVMEDGTPIQWAKYDENKIYELPEYKPKTNAKAVLQYDLEGNFIAEYESAREAEKVTGIGYKMISRVCKGERERTHGCVFKFKSDT